jgi:hypothetical protein
LKGMYPHHHTHINIFQNFITVTAVLAYNWSSSMFLESLYTGYLESNLWQVVNKTSYKTKMYYIQKIHTYWSYFSM